jgi:hypothetical protein
MWATGPVHFHLQPRQATLTIITHGYGSDRTPRAATITCPQFAAQLLPTLRTAFFRAQAQNQLLSCDAYWLRYQVHDHLLAGEVDYYFAHELDFLDQAAALLEPFQGRYWPCAVLTFGPQHVHVHGAPTPKWAEQGEYVRKPFISRLWPSSALALLQNELRRNGALTNSWVPYNSDLFTSLRRSRKFRLLSAR